MAVARVVGGRVGGVVVVGFRVVVVRGRVVVTQSMQLGVVVHGGVPGRPQTVWADAGPWWAVSTTNAITSAAITSLGARDSLRFSTESSPLVGPVADQGNFPSIHRSRAAAPERLPR